MNEIAPYPQEGLLLDVVAEIAEAAVPVRRVICTSTGLAQFAAAAARLLPGAVVGCTYLDLYRAKLARGHWQDGPANLRIDCAADLVGGERDQAADVVAFPFSASGEAELTRELIQAGHVQLRVGGTMYASTDNPSDTWLGEQLRKIFHGVERRRYAGGALYVATKREQLKKTKNFVCEFAFRDRGRLIQAVTRPGVFSHRSLDTGARRLIDAMDIDAGARVLDIGCGAGVVALAAAARAEKIAVHAVDSSARAVECTQRGAEMNGLANVSTELSADGNFIGAGTYDLALANPPYYAGFRIARHFLTAGRDALRPGGTILVVTKRPECYEENMPEWFDELSVVERKRYFIFQGVRGA